MLYILYYIFYFVYFNFHRFIYAATHTQFSSIGSHHVNLNAIASPMKIPQSHRKQEIINEGYTTDANVAESSFTESVTTAMEYRIRLVEDVELLSDGNVTMVSVKFVGCAFIFHLNSCLLN